MSEYSQQLSLRLASVTAELGSLKQRQPKLDNLTRVLHEMNTDKVRLLEHIEFLNQDLEMSRIQLASALKQKANKTEESGEDSLQKKLQTESINPVDSLSPAKLVVQGNSHELLENLIRELNLCKQQLQKMLDGKIDIRTFLKAADYEETISKLEDDLKDKDKETEDLRAELKERDIEGNDESSAKKMDEMKQQLTKLARALNVKSVLVDTMTHELDRTEKECQAMKEKYNQEIQSLREEKQRLSKHRSDDEQTIKMDMELKKQLTSATEEIERLNQKLTAFQKEFNILDQDYVISEQTRNVLQRENQDLKTKCQQLELKVDNCQKCRILESEKDELLQKTAQLEEELNLVTTQMKYYEEDFKHERKDREDMKNRYDSQIDEQRKQIDYFSMEIHRIGSLVRKEKLEKEGLQKRLRQMSSYRQDCDLSTDTPRQSFHGGCKSYAYGQQQQPVWHSALPREVVADIDNTSDDIDNQGTGSLASHMTRECPRCEREFGPQERDEFERHVEKCLN
ncbi:uncharacterized protein LOC144452162 [Glandiceps talaboti]